MGLNPKQMEAVLALDGPKRFRHFVKVVTDRQEVWGLYQDGWALAGGDDGATVFPLWPASDYAQLCAVDDWQSYEPRAIPLHDFLTMLLPKLQQDGVLPGVFYTPAGKGVTPSAEELRAALEEELRNY